MVNHRAVCHYISTDRALKKLKSFLNHLIVGIQILVLQNLHATKHSLRNGHNSGKFCSIYNDLRTNLMYEH
jgi:hypothetical protein